VGGEALVRVKRRKKTRGGKQGPLLAFTRLKSGKDAPSIGEVRGFAVSTSAKKGGGSSSRLDVGARKKEGQQTFGRGKKGVPPASIRTKKRKKKGERRLGEGTNPPFRPS